MEYFFLVIRPCEPSDVPQIHDIINTAAQVYKEVLPADVWHDPYMSMEHLAKEIAAGVCFLGSYDGDQLQAVMGHQAVRDVTLIRHAYVRPASQRSGIGGQLLRQIEKDSDRRLLVGTWAAATWAIRFYERHGFAPVPPEKTDELLQTYWTIPARQRELSVVLVRAPARQTTG